MNTRQRDSTRAAVALAICAVSWSSSYAAQADTKPVDGTRIEGGDADAGNWLSCGRTYSEQRYSPLKRINADNAKDLGLAWFADLDTNRGQEATPLALFGGGRHVPVGQIGVSNRWQHLRCRRAPFDPRLALRALDWSGRARDAVGLSSIFPPR
jgi:hypothetical protein